MFFFYIQAMYFTSQSLKMWIIFFIYTRIPNHIFYFTIWRCEYLFIHVYKPCILLHNLWRCDYFSYINNVFYRTNVLSLMHWSGLEYCHVLTSYKRPLKVCTLVLKCLHPCAHDCSLEGEKPASIKCVPRITIDFETSVFVKSRSDLIYKNLWKTYHINIAWVRFSLKLWI